MTPSLHYAALAQIEVLRTVRAGQPPTVVPPGAEHSVEYRNFVQVFGSELPEDVRKGLEEVGVR